MLLDAVPFAAAVSAGVALAIIRSTLFAVRVFITVVQRLASPATCVSNFTVLPAFSSSALRASMKPFVALSSDSCSMS